MSDRPPNFHELAGGDDLSAEEANRLERVHDLLVAAGPPPELPPHLLEPQPEQKRDNVSFLPRRRVGMLLGIAAAIAITAFLGGFVYGANHAPFDEAASVPMHSTVAGSQASAVIHVGNADSAGNWPLKVEVRDLPSLPKGQYYEMFLSRGADKRAASCGTFRASGDEKDIRLNAPYRIRSFNGWVVTRESPGSGKHPVVLST